MRKGLQSRKMENAGYGRGLQGMCNIWDRRGLQWEAGVSYEVGMGVPNLKGNYRSARYR